MFTMTPARRAHGRRDHKRRAVVDAFVATAGRISAAMGATEERGRALAVAIEDESLPAWQRLRAGIAALELVGLLDHRSARRMMQLLAVGDSAVFDVLGNLVAIPQLGTIAEDLGVKLGLPPGFGPALMKLTAPARFLQRARCALVDGLNIKREATARWCLALASKFEAPFELEITPPTHRPESLGVRSAGKHVMSIRTALAPPVRRCLGQYSEAPAGSFAHLAPVL